MVQVPTCTAQLDRVDRAVLEQLSRHGVLTTSQVGRRAGLLTRDAYARLRRLVRARLVDTAPSGDARWTPNAWWLTPAGAEATPWPMCTPARVRSPVQVTEALAASTLTVALDRYGDAVGLRWQPGSWHDRRPAGPSWEPPPAALGHIAVRDGGRVPVAIDAHPLTSPASLAQRKIDAYLRYCTEAAMPPELRPMLLLLCQSDTRASALLDYTETLKRRRAAAGLLAVAQCVQPLEDAVGAAVWRTAQRREPRSLAATLGDAP